MIKIWKDEPGWDDKFAEIEAEWDEFSEEWFKIVSEDE
jgi:hypothetical protein